MSQFPSSPFGAARQPLNYRAGYDELSVAQFFNAVFAWMAVGLAVTAAVAYWVAMTPSVFYSLRGGSIFLIVIAQLVLVVSIGTAINRISTSVATVMFLIYAALNGLILSTLFLAYAHATLGATFIITAGLFGAMSLYGYVTKRDLTRLGSLLFMALIGIIIASLVNIFFMNPMVTWIVSYIGVIIFVGLTAYDTQKLKEIAMQTGGNPALAHRQAIVGSLVLYLDFLNLFLLLLQIMGDRRK